MKNMRAPQRNSQTGILLIEAMVAILIFTIGVIALMGVQAVAVRATSDAKIRMDAELFVDQLLSEMVIDSRVIVAAAPAAPPPTPVANASGGGVLPGSFNVARLSARYASALNGAGFQRWRDRVVNVAGGGLPGILTAAEQPTVIITDVSVAGTDMARVDVIVFWRAPKDPPAAPARRVVVSSILS